MSKLPPRRARQEQIEESEKTLERGTDICANSAEGRAGEESSQGGGALGGEGKVLGHNEKEERADVAEKEEGAHEMTEDGDEEVEEQELVEGSGCVTVCAVHFLTEEFQPLDSAQVL